MVTLPDELYKMKGVFSLIHKLEHIGVMVKDMDASIRFYTEVIGMKLVKRKALADGVELGFMSFPDSDKIEIELIGRGHDGLPDNGLVHHIAFTVSDIQAEIDRLKTFNVKLMDETPRTILEGDLIAFFFGPDGERLEFFQPASQ
ncbi:VOC family protein [Paenibacillus agricola]|uniref:VOC family protein n=1 Tax=Paenibacillus agricola TaxID=2716264 RepID=UPI001FB7154B|nr:VOC family protein [Paenibacillus agricola]